MSGLPKLQLLSRSIALIFGLWASATAATLQQLSLNQMAQDATTIVRARVTGSSAALNGATIYTHYKLLVSETWKGTAAPEVMIPGGVAGGYRQSFPGIPALQTGSEYILFLWKSPTTGITHLVGLSQGILNVTQQSNGSFYVSRSLIGETMLDAYGHPVRDQPVGMLLSDLKTRVSEALSTQAPASQTPATRAAK